MLQEGKRQGRAKAMREGEWCEENETGNLFEEPLVTMKLRHGDM